MRTSIFSVFSVFNTIILVNTSAWARKGPALCLNKFALALYFFFLIDDSSTFSLFSCHFEQTNLATSMHQGAALRKFLITFWWDLSRTNLLKTEHFSFQTKIASCYSRLKHRLLQGKCFVPVCSPETPRKLRPWRTLFPPSFLIPLAKPRCALFCILFSRNTWKQYENLEAAQEQRVIVPTTSQKLLFSQCRFGHFFLRCSQIWFRKQESIASGLRLAIYLWHTLSGCTIHLVFQGKNLCCNQIHRISFFLS